MKKYIGKLVCKFKNGDINKELTHTPWMSGIKFKKIKIVLVTLSLITVSYPQDSTAFIQNASDVIDSVNNSKNENLYFKNSFEPGKPPNSNSIIPALNFKDTDLRDVVRGIAFEYETNIIIENDVNKRISIALFNIPVFNAVKVIATDNGLDFSYDESRFYIKNRAAVIPPPPKEFFPEVAYSKGKLSIRLQNTELVKFVDELRLKTKHNFLIASGTSGNLTGALNNVSLEIGLKNLLQNNGFYLTERDSIYYISRSVYFSSVPGNNDNSAHPYWISANGGLISIDVAQAQLDRIINDLSNQLGLQIVKLTNPDALVSVKCTEVPLKKALNYIFKGTKFTYKADKGTILIGSKDSKELENTRLIKLSYLRADKIKETLPQSFLKGLSITVSLEHNGLIVSGQNEEISSVEEYLAVIDQPVPQVLIEALVVDYNLDKIFQLGISAGKQDSTQLMRPDKFYPSVDATIGGAKINKFLNDIGTINLFGKDFDVAKLGKLSPDFYVNIKALEQHGIANVKSKPILSTLNGHTASLKIGTTQNYVFTEVVPIMNAVNSTFIEKETLQKIEANISFEITPWVGPNNELTLEIKPEFETPIGAFSPDKKYIPAINTRSLVSTVRLRDGETIILGGLIQESETNSEDKFPILGDIPIIGELFTNRNKQTSKGELLIYLTPKIYYGDEYNYASNNSNKK